jgi:hypothetical protein
LTGRLDALPGQERQDAAERGAPLQADLPLLGEAEPAAVVAHHQRRLRGAGEARRPAGRAPARERADQDPPGEPHVGDRRPVAPGALLPEGALGLGAVERGPGGIGGGDPGGGPRERRLRAKEGERVAHRRGAAGEDGLGPGQLDLGGVGVPEPGQRRPEHHAGLGDQVDVADLGGVDEGLLPELPRGVGVVALEREAAAVPEDEALGGAIARDFIAPGPPAR